MPCLPQARKPTRPISARFFRHRQYRRRRIVPPEKTSATTVTTPISSSPPTRARPPSPIRPIRSPRKPASGLTTRLRRAGRLATTIRRWASPPASHGKPSSVTSARWISTSSRPPFTVAGVGDMSGDVFGNGMLLSRARSASSRSSTTATSSLIPIRTWRRLSPSASGCSTCRVRAGRTMTSEALQGRHDRLA